MTAPRTIFEIKQREMEALEKIEVHLDWLVKFLKAIKIPSWLRVNG